MFFEVPVKVRHLLLSSGINCTLQKPRGFMLRGFLYALKYPYPYVIPAKAGIHAFISGKKNAKFQVKF